MHKKDFIQAASIQFMPELQWDVDKSIAYAEKLWARLSEKGYGEPKQTGPRETDKAYDKLPPVMKAAFDVFWRAFDYKAGKDGAAARWLQMGELPKAEYDAIFAAAKQEAQRRKTLPEGQTPIMAQGWLTQRRWLDYAATETDQRRREQNQHQQTMIKLNGNLAHAKMMLEQLGGDYWQGEVEKLTEQLKQLRDSAPETT
jgi:hypothetical protein